MPSGRGSRLHVVHLVSESAGTRHLRVLQALLQHGGGGAPVVVDHGSRLRRWFCVAGIRAREARLSYAPSRWHPARGGVLDLLWEEDARFVHIHGGEVAPSGIAAARWLELPVIFTPAGGTETPAPPPRQGFFANLFRRNRLRRVDALMLVDQPVDGAIAMAAGRPVLTVSPGMSIGRITIGYQALLEEIDLRIGREPVAAGRPMTLAS